MVKETIEGLDIKGSFDPKPHAKCSFGEFQETI